MALQQKNYKEKNDQFFIEERENMKKTVETQVSSGLKPKYVVNKEDLDDLLKDLKKYVVEDDYPSPRFRSILIPKTSMDPRCPCQTV